MQHLFSLQDIHFQDTWLTIGSYDGVHRGHRGILKSLTTGAHEEGRLAAVLTFHPHPAIVLHGPREDFYLTSPEEKADLLGEAGVDIVITHPFNLQVASQSAGEFMSYLKTHLGVKHLLVGHDFVLGRNREGDVGALRELGQELDYELHTMDTVLHRGEVISSSLIRHSIRDRNVIRAADLLGRPYQITGQVKTGDGRGRTIGIPTANLFVEKERTLPGSGVYATRAFLGSVIYDSVTNIGLRPTFDTGEKKQHVETHLLDFDDEIYGQHLRLQFITHLRDEKRFQSVNLLVDQIHADITRARELLSVSALSADRPAS
jgi:riboflavin kinase/FMN adenylyltransferase